MRKPCECRQWCDTHPQIRFLTGHHENCPRRVPMDVAWHDLVRRLVKGMELWAHDEDGIHPDAWEAYKHGKSVLGQFDWKEDNELSPRSSGVKEGE